MIRLYCQTSRDPHASGLHTESHTLDLHKDSSSVFITSVVSQVTGDLVPVLTCDSC